MKRKIRFIINPKSGIHAKHDIPNLIEKHLDHLQFEYDFIHTEYRKHAKSLAIEAAENGWDIVCAVGGDGSVHEVGTGLIHSSTALAILPAGSGNGLARHLHIPLDLAAAIQHLNSAQIQEMDTVLANDKPFLNIGGYGFDAHIAQEFDKVVHRGFWGYVKLILKEYFSYPCQTYEFTVNGATRNERLLLISIANATEFGNGFCLSPQSKINDGQLELCLLHPFAGWKAPRIIHRFFNGTVHKVKQMEIIPFQEMLLKLPLQRAHYDGEPFEVRPEISIQVRPKSLRIFV